MSTNKIGRIIVKVSHVYICASLLLWQVLAAAVLAVATALPSPGEDVQIVEASPLNYAAAQQYVYPVAVEPSTYAQSRSGDLVALGSGWGSKPLISVGWAPAQQQSSGWGWAPKVKYLKFSIPIPVLPRIKFGVKGGLRLHASIQQPKGWEQPKGWGWSR